MSAEFLSEEWFEELASRLAHTTSPPEGTAVRIGQIARETPSGDEVGWAIVLEPGETPRVDRSPTAPADFTLVATYDTLRRLAAGEFTAAQLLTSGELKLEGDVSRLLGSAELLEAISGALGATTA